MGTKVGLMTKDEAKFFGQIIAGQLPVGGVWKPVVGWVLPNAIDTLDNKFGDKLPEPWQTHVENFFTKLYDAMQDKIITEEELNDLENFTADVLNQEIDIPGVEEADELVQFMLLIKYGVQSILIAVKKMKNDN